MKTVIEMAKEVGAGVGTSGRWLMTQVELEQLAALVRADEREACAQLAEKLTWADNNGVASAIRARGNT